MSTRAFRWGGKNRPANGTVVRTWRDCYDVTSQFGTKTHLEKGLVGVVEGPNVIPSDSRVMFFRLGRSVVVDNAQLEPVDV